MKTEKDSNKMTLSVETSQDLACDGHPLEHPRPSWLVEGVSVPPKLALF